MNTVRVILAAAALLLGPASIHAQDGGGAGARLRAFAAREPGCTAAVADTAPNAIHLAAVPLGDPAWPEAFCFTAANRVARAPESSRDGLRPAGHVVTHAAGRLRRAGAAG